MEIFLQILIATIFAVGLGFILSDVFKIPKYPVSKAMTILGKRQKKKTNPLDIWLGDLANFIASRMKLNEYKRLQLKVDIDSADMTVSPEQYVANAIVKALFIGVFAIPFLFFAPIISALIVVIAVVTYFSEYKKVGNIIKTKRQKIEYELPRLVSNIDKTLSHSRDVLGILDSYREHAGEELRRELDITVADMRSGNYEVALTRLESRVGSSMMSDVTRGLISVIHGDKTDVYWGNLVLKFSDYQRTLLKNEANKAPKKVRKLSMALLFCFMLVYVVVIGQVLTAKYPPIITNEQFESVAMLISAKYGGYNKDPRATILKKRTFCQECGERITRDIQSARYHKWYCKGCLETALREERFYERILSALNAVIAHPELLDEVEPKDT